ncbi:MAG: histidinol-phosphate aminotransferase [Actinomycetota bacterium]|jgi:histidinol-phosphate aminotransferase|nr:histidinol-phosphate aminotransferase [Actinomycetota bacterium]
MGRSTAPAHTDFGAQGGDPRRRAGGVRLDLSTCVNRYGPPPAARSVLAQFPLSDLQIHPYAAAGDVAAAYAGLLGVDPGTLVAGRGTTEFIWALGRQVPHSTVAVPLPAYTDYLRAFPGRGFPGSRPETVPSLGLVDEAMRDAGLVIVSNPHNPSGVRLDPDGLVEVAARHRRCTLVVDESYVEFLLDPAAATVIGRAGVGDNVVALRSPSKFYGIAATRAGVAWCRDRDRLDDLLGPRETWPISGLDAAMAVAALASGAWAEQSRRQLADDGAWVAMRLRRANLDVIEEHVGVHYRCVTTSEPDALAERFAAHGIGVRPLGAAHGVDSGAVRVLAPRWDERRTFAQALDRVAATATAELQPCG